MNSKHIETLKFVGGALIVGAAALIMFPGFISLAAGFGKIILMIVIAGGAALALAYATAFVRRQRKSTEQQTNTTESS